MRRLPLLLLLVLLPIPAYADRHRVKASAVISTEEEQALAARVSVGFRLGDTPYPARDHTPSIAGGGAKAKRSLFLIAEGAEYVAGRDSGHFLDGWMIGLRYLTRGPSNIEPYFHALGGRQRQSRRNTITASDDAATDWSNAVAVGGGVDVEVNQSEMAVIVPVLRLQLDLVESGATSGFHPYGRVSFGVSFRYEPHK